ncbi:RING-type domain-containing protein [Aphelenchoides besseyi]|nr:RING-type domain-containing protein [Aphelenchoides besseyi]KAI6201104.1 RING-type domain-containing protein [Aphelenchoides besseyi]
MADTAQLRQLLMCSICREIVIDPVRLKLCGHTFCHVCLVQHCEQQNRCPHCNQELDQNFSPRCYTTDLNLQQLAYRFFPIESSQSLRRQFDIVYRLKSSNLQVCASNLVSLARNLCLPDDMVRVRVVMQNTQSTTGLQGETMELDDYEMILRCRHDLQIRSLKKIFIRKFFPTISCLKLDFFSADSLLLRDSATISDVVLQTGHFDGLRPIVIIANVHQAKCPVVIDEMPILEVQSYEVDANGPPVLSKPALLPQRTPSLQSPVQMFEPLNSSNTAETNQLVFSLFNNKATIERPKSTVKRKKEILDGTARLKQLKRTESPTINPTQLYSFISMLNSTPTTSGSLPNSMNMPSTRSNFVESPTSPVFPRFPPFLPIDSKKNGTRTLVNQSLPPALIQRLLSTAVTYNRNTNLSPDVHPSLASFLQSNVQKKNQSKEMTQCQWKPGVAVSPIRRDQLSNGFSQIQFSNVSPPDKPTLSTDTSIDREFCCY